MSFCLDRGQASFRGEAYPVSYLRSRPYNPAREPGELPSGLWGEAPAKNDFGAFFGPENATHYI